MAASSTQVVIRGVMLVVVVCRWRWEGDSGGCVNDWSCRCPGGGDHIIDRGGGGGSGGHAGGCRVIEGGGKAVVMAGSLMQVIVDDNDVGIWDCSGCVEGSSSSGGGHVVGAAEWGWWLCHCRC